MDQQRIMDVLLHDARLLAVAGAVRDQLLDLVEILGYLDALSSVCVFAWLYDPDVLLRHLRTVEVILLRLLLRF